ncbi:MAG: hypothetical protein CMI01_09770 [Oceanospirillaceae bacterium]|jgi:uncharacterized membrane protein YbaN (DUF454 family)|nr:hypothetical protein [Oceanospirillaceae bacterium]
MKTGQTDTAEYSSMRWFWLAVTWIAIGLAMLGVLLPGLPTTVFVLIAAWSASRSSPRLRRWLISHATFGPILHNWERGGVIDRRSKVVASIGMLVALLIVIYVIRHPLILMLILSALAVGAVVVWSRPEQIPEHHRDSGI